MQKHHILVRWNDDVLKLQKPLCQSQPSFLVIDYVNPGFSPNTMTLSRHIDISNLELTAIALLVYQHSHDANEAEPQQQEIQS